MAKWKEASLCVWETLKHERWEKTLLQDALEKEKFSKSALKEALKMGNGNCGQSGSQGSIAK